jgi:glycosyltransferase involved in cell wall biosynthesis
MQDYLTRIEQLVDKVEDWTRLPAQPLVSVWFITYNHESYIAQALDSILMQEVDFDYEVVIGEDKSTDRTREIVEEYQRRHPDKIRLRLARENLYSQKLKPGLGVLAACRGQYIALLEGDDYWTDPRKLQKQVDFLEANVDYSMCFHRALCENTRKIEAKENTIPSKLDKNTFDTADFCENCWFYPTASIVYRNYDDFVLPAWVNQCASGDIPLVMLLSLRGRVKYLPETMSVYRAHQGGVSVGHMGYRMIIDRAFLLESFNKHTGSAYNALLFKQLSEMLGDMVPLDWRDAMLHRTAKRIKKGATGEAMTALNRGGLTDLIGEMVVYDVDFAKSVLRDVFVDVCWSRNRGDFLQALNALRVHDAGYFLNKRFYHAICHVVKRLFR